MSRVLPALLLLACHEPPREPRHDRVPEGLSLGPISQPLPGTGAQHHATLACSELGCIAARQVGAGVRFSTLDPDGTATSFELPPSPPVGWNHPEIRAEASGWRVIAATAGAPTVLALGPSGAPSGPALPIHAPFPWGQWPDLALGGDGRALAFWSTKTEAWWRVFDPDDPDAAPPATLIEAALPLGTIDPPAAVAVPGGYVRAWTEKDGAIWRVLLLQVDLDGLPLHEPILVAEGSGVSRGARPQLAAKDDGAIAVAWRIWSDVPSPPEGAFVRLYEPDGSPRTEVLRLDVDRGDRPTVAEVPGGWLVAWEEGEPHAVFVQALGPDGEALSDPLPVSQAAIPAGRANLGGLAADGAWSGLISWEEVRAEKVDQILDADVRVRPVTLE